MSSSGDASSRFEYLLPPSEFVRIVQQMRRTGTSQGQAAGGRVSTAVAQDHGGAEDLDRREGAGRKRNGDDLDNPMLDISGGS